MRASLGARGAIAPAFLVWLLSSLGSGCNGPSTLPGLGQPCPIALCATGLGCSAGGFCEKNCECINGRTLCIPTTLAMGCPPFAVCVVNSSNGGGTCQARCDDGQCPPGEPRCAAAPDQTTACVGPDFNWMGLDGATSDQSGDH